MKMKKTRFEIPQVILRFLIIFRYLHGVQLRKEGYAK